MTRDLADFGALVVAAGASRRMGEADKLLTPFRGKPLVEHALGTLSALGLSQILLVAGTNELSLRSVASRFGCNIVPNPMPDRGIGSSIAEGAAALNPDLKGAFIALADMPLIETETFHKLAEAFEPTDVRIAVPGFEGRRGHPVLFDADIFPELMELNEDVGARQVMNREPGRVANVDVSDSGILIDLDCEVDFERYA